MLPQLEREERSLVTVVSTLAKTEQWPNGRLPCDYMVIDTETTGVSTSSDTILQYGLCYVRDCKVSHELWDSDTRSVMLRVPASAFVGKEEAVKVHGITYERTQQEGIDVEEGYKILLEVLDFCKSQGIFIVGHNLYRFDIPFLQTEFSRHGVTFRFAPNEVVDTAMLVKAMRVPMLPGPTERAYEFWHRVSSMPAKGVRYNLGDFCIDRFGLYKYGADKGSAHDAGYDCWLSHLLVQEINDVMVKEQVNA